MFEKKPPVQDKSLENRIQLNPNTRLALEYIESIGGLITLHKYQGFSAVKEFIQEKGVVIPFYTEYLLTFLGGEKSGYSEKDLVNDKNKEDVQKIDECVTRLNGLIKSGGLTEDAFINLTSEIEKILRSKKKADIIPLTPR